MRHIINFIWFWIMVAIILMIAFYQVVIGFLILSMASVILTWIYGKLTGNSYHFLTDQSRMLYRINKFGEFLWLIAGCVIAYLISKHLF